ncbi:MAG: hypothetical protein AAB886_00865 [Patescibacteria group bacterium]
MNIQLPSAFLASLLVFFGAGCAKTQPVVTPDTSSPISIQNIETDGLKSATLKDFIRERKTFPSFSDIEGRARPIELEGMVELTRATTDDGATIIVLGPSDKSGTTFFLKELSAGKSPITYGPITGSLAELLRR